MLGRTRAAALATGLSLVPERVMLKEFWLIAPLVSVTL